MSETTTALPATEFWAGRRVLLTGHTGFKGSWLSAWLIDLGATVMGLSLPEPPSRPSLWEQLSLDAVIDVRGDVATKAWYADAVRFSPDIVLHLAAQPLVSVGYDAPARTFETNVMGTVRVLDLLERLPDVEVALVITTDKVYDPAQTTPYDESHHFGGREPYSGSKAAAEIVVSSWPKTKTAVATARAGNVIGGGDWAANRVVPDLVRAWRNRETMVLRRPASVRPWQHVLEPLRGYLLYAEALSAGVAVSGGLNFGPADAQSVSVRDLVAFSAQEWQRLGADLPVEPWRALAEPQYSETGELTLDSRRAADELGWSSVLDWQQAVRLTLEWYRGFEAGASPGALVADQLAAYSMTIRSQP